MNWCVVIFFIFLLWILWKTCRESHGLLSLPFLIMLYIVFLYLGSLYFYFTEGHYTFLFVFFMAFFYLVGIYLANLLVHLQERLLFDKPLSIYTPVNLSILRFALSAMFFLVLGIAIYRLYKFGVPLFEQTWYTKGIRSTTGISNRLLFTTGVESLIIMCLISYGMWKSQNKLVFKYLMLQFFIFYIIFKLLQGGKEAAIMPFLLMGMAIFYNTRKIPKKLILLSGAAIFVLILLVGSFWTGVFSIDKIFNLFYVRVTSIAALHVDYLLYGWAPNHSYELGNTVLLEFKRFVAQVTSIPKEPLFNEFIGNLKAGHSLSKVTGVSPELSLFGMAYANFGILGAVFSALIFVFIVQRMNIHLLSRRSMNIFSFTLWIYFFLKLLGFVRGGNVLITLETFLIGVIPALTMIAITYFCLALPFPSAMRWKRYSWET